MLKPQDPRNETRDMKGGRFIAVVGPSGAGKDSVMEGLCVARADLHRVRRVITREANAGGEDFEAVSERQFASRVARGDFALHWPAHGLFYGIPKDTHSILAQGQDALANLSRGMLGAAAQEFDALVVLHLTASPDILARRLSLRGREKGDALAKRLAHPAPAMPTDLEVIDIDNSGTLAASIAAALAALYPESS